MTRGPRVGKARSLAWTMGLTRVVLILSAAASLAVGTWLLRSRADDVMRRRAADAHLSIERLVVDQAEARRLLASSLVQAEAVRTALASDLDRDTVEDVIASELGAGQVDMFRIVDASGKLFALHQPGTGDVWTQVPARPGWTMQLVDGRPHLIATVALELRPDYVVHLSLGGVFTPPTDVERRTWQFSGDAAMPACQRVERARGWLGGEAVTCTAAITTPEGSTTWTVMLDAHDEWLHAVSVLAGSGAVIAIGTLAVLWLLQVIARRDREMTRAKEAAEAATRAKAEFLAMMSHEIRTPMNAVIGMAELLQRTAIDTRQMGYLTTLRGAANALLTVINDILDISKIEAGKLELRVADVDLRELVEDICAVHATQAHAKKLELVCDMPAGAPSYVRIDADRVRQIIVNLLGNAIKFTQSGEVTVRVRTEARGASVAVSIAVEDTGVGISAEDQRQLFTPFWQADTSYTRKQGGTGLGLAIASRLAKLMGSELEVESEPGKGTRFHFSLVAERAVTGRSRRVTGRLHQLDVLVVDDNATNRLIVQQQLEAWGMTCTTVDSGPSALAAISRARAEGAPFDVVLLDGHMPEMSGLDVARAIAKQGAADLRVVMLTSIDADSTEAASAGIDDWLTKPVRQAQLHDCLVRLCAPARTKPAAENRAAEVATSAWRGARVLLAEDNEVNQIVALDMLKELGIDPTIANDGAEAVEQTRKHRFDIIFMDCQMPILDGYEATGQIRHLEGGAHRTPIVALTAHAMVGDRETALAAGMDDYLVKPVTLAALEEALARWVKRSPSTARNAAPRAPTSTEKLPSAPLPTPSGPLPSASGSLPVASPVPSPPIDILAPSRFRTRKVVEMFFEVGPKDLESIRSAADAATLRSQAHRLKGSALAMGLPRLAKTCEELEKLGARGELAVAAAALDRLVAEFEATKSALAEEIASESGTAPPARKS